MTGSAACWPRLRPERGFFCCSLLRPNSDFDSTVRVARSFASWASKSNVSTRDASVVLSASKARTSARSRAFFSRSHAMVRSRASTNRAAAARRRSSCLRSDAIWLLCLSADWPSASRSQPMSFFSQSISSRCRASIRSLWAWDPRSQQRRLSISPSRNLILPS